jgi:hypothetical protein
MGRIGLFLAGGFITAIVMLSFAPEPRERTATILSIGQTNDGGTLTVTVQVDGLDETVENAGETGALKTTGKTVTVKIGKYSAPDAAVGKRMQIMVGPQAVHFWRWK